MNIYEYLWIFIKYKIMVLNYVKIETSKKIPLKNKNAKKFKIYTREYLGIFENQNPKKLILVWYNHTNT